MTKAKKGARSLSVVLTFVCFACAGDIKGENGKDALSNPLVRIARPSYYSLSDTVVAVDGSSANPALFKFGSNIFTSEDTLLCDITKSGTGGLRTGLSLESNSTYYLYGVKNNETPGLVADIDPPTKGPKNFSEWTYMGAFPVNDASLPSFTSSNGYMISSGVGPNISIVNSIPSQPKTLQIPITTASVLLRSYWTAINALSDDLYVESKSFNAFTSSRHNATSTSVSENSILSYWVPILTPQTIFAAVTTANLDSVNLSVFGWVENPLDYQ